MTKQLKNIQVKDKIKVSGQSFLPKSEITVIEVKDTDDETDEKIITAKGDWGNARDWVFKVTSKGGMLTSNERGYFQLPVSVDNIMKKETNDVQVKERKFNGTSTLEVVAESKELAKAGARGFWKEEYGSSPSRIVAEEQGWKNHWDVMVADHSSGSLKDSKIFEF